MRGGVRSLPSEPVELRQQGRIVEAFLQQKALLSKQLSSAATETTPVTDDSPLEHVVLDVVATHVVQSGDHPPKEILLFIVEDGIGLNTWNHFALVVP